MIRGVAVVALVCGVGCPGVPQPLEEPHVELRSAEIVDSSLSVELAVVNPNREALVAEAIDWQLEVDDEPVARGREALQVDVAALAPAAVSVRAALAPAQRAAFSGRAALSGTVHLRAARGLVAGSFYGPVEAPTPTPTPTP